MGRSTRSRPLKLGKKLKQIRLSLELSQAQMVKHLAAKNEPIYPASISMYECGKREPSLRTLLAYARLGNVTVESLIDDEMGLAIKRRKKTRRLGLGILRAR
jgi:transcriptional regulator with XRE-family HTH domain